MHWQRKCTLEDSSGPMSRTGLEVGALYIVEQHLFFVAYLRIVGGGSRRMWCSPER